MGRLNIIIFLVVLTISGYVTGNRTVSFPKKEVTVHRLVTYRHALRVSKTTRPHAETCKVYYKIRYKGSEIKFDPDVFHFVVRATVNCPVVINQRPFQFISGNRRTTVSLRGPPFSLLA